MRTGLYIHIPFCLSKCPYCDFYSVRYSRTRAEGYAAAVIRNIRHYGEKYDTVYFGGGTPILLYEHIGDILRAADIAENSETTVEANPCAVTPEIAARLAEAGVNRVSLGVQSMNAGELSFLGRRHTPAQVRAAFASLKAAGIENISADMMIGLPGQSETDISGTALTLAELGARHISAYILKIEENTPFARQDIALPDDDRTADLYLYTARELERLGFAQYEISNFALTGYECRHNLKYWRCGEYLGIGAAAHSYYKGKRFRVPPDIGAFTAAGAQDTVVTDEDPGGWEEFAMLKLRLTEGITFDEAARFGKTEELRKNAAGLPRNLVSITERGVNLTLEGFPVSNAVIGRIIY
ncbi:MAG: radical SAM family heme chaperone HemW [Ruminiclostridium sp.]|nr:radical SAM family heme chaperone HemW [Ruminiclostridium sp.]